MKVLLWSGVDIFYSILIPNIFFGLLFLEFCVSNNILNKYED